MPGTRTYRYPVQTVAITAGSVTNLTCPEPFQDLTDIDKASKDGTSLTTYPNPFNGNLNISLSIKEASNVQVLVFDVNGKVVSTIQNGQLSNGTYNLNWNASGSGLESGLYIIRVISDNQAPVQRTVFYNK